LLDSPKCTPELLLTGKSKRNKIKRLRRRPFGAAKQNRTLIRRWDRNDKQGVS
jgi:hypothetical protein